MDLLANEKLVVNVCASLGGVPLQGNFVLTTKEHDRQVDQNPVGQAVHWACVVWSAWYTALTLRTSSGLPQGSCDILNRNHKVCEDPAESIVHDLATRYLSSSKYAVKYVKEQTTWLSAQLLGQEDSEMPLVTLRDGSPIITKGKEGIFGGSWVYERVRLLKRRCCVSGPCDHSTMMYRLGLALDLLNSKTGMPAVDEAFVDGTLHSYSEDMTRSVILGCDTEVQSRIKDAIRARIDTLVDRIFRGKVLNIHDQIPSLNASFENAQKYGGSFGALLAKWAENVHPDAPSFDVPREGEPDPAVCPSFDVEEHSIDPNPLSKDVNGTRGPVKLALPGLDLMPSWRQFLDQEVREVVCSGKIDAKPFAIKEPLKCRVITMQQSVATAYAMMMQKEMHSIMRRIPCFQYMGGPIEDESWMKHFSRVLLDGEVYLSGDYDGATNNMDPTFSLYAWDSICRVLQLPDGMPLLGSVWHELGRLDLVGHLFDFSKSGDGVRQQTWGQLMGSPTSFPILCLVNVAASSVGLGLSVDQTLSETCEIVVNGDDLAAVCSRDRYDEWKFAVGCVGFKLSLGKNYISKEFMIMNSECRCPLTVAGILKKWDYVGFLNQALLRGYEKKGIFAGDDLKPTMTWRDLGARARELVTGLPQKTASHALTEFIRCHKTVLADVPQTCSWWVSEQLGGVGLPNVDGVPITTENLQTATRVSCLDIEARMKLLSKPKATRKGLLDQLLSDSEAYYKKIFPVRVQDRDPWDITLESWGIPLPREKSDIGSTLRMAFVLKGFLAWYSGLTADARVALLSADSRDKTHVVPSIGSSIDPLGLARDVKRLKARLEEFGHTAKHQVLPWNLDDHLPTPEEFADDLFKAPKLHLIRVEAAQRWTPPQELVVDYRSPSLLPVYDGFCNVPIAPRRRGRRVPTNMERFFVRLGSRLLESVAVPPAVSYPLAVVYRNDYDPTQGIQPLLSDFPDNVGCVSWVDFYRSLFAVGDSEGAFPEETVSQLKAVAVKSV
jgi:hypothetical protein